MTQDSIIWVVVILKKTKLNKHYCSIYRKEDYIMNFWNTVLGQRLAETLNYCLPKLVKEKEQYTVLSCNENLQKRIEAELAKGAKVVSMVSTANYGTVIVFEK